MEKNFSRRSFLTGSLALGAVAATAGLAGCADNQSEEPMANTGVPADDRSWDQEADVVVVGMGFAGLAAAHTAASEGASVLLIEKAPEKYAGGNSRVCGQAIISPQDVDVAVDYFKEITSEYHLTDIDDSVIRAFFEEAKGHYDWLLNEFDIETVWGTTCEYPAAKTAEAFTAEPNGILPSGGMGGAAVWTPMWEVLKETDGVTLQYDTAFTDLIVNAEGEAIGIEALANGSIVAIKAKKGVIMCLGGFEFDQTLLANYTRIPSMAWGTPYNTGDGIKALMKHDVDFWHMNSATIGCRVGAKADWMGEDFKGAPLDGEIAGDTGFFWTDKYGKRFMDESRPYTHGYARSAFGYNDSMKMEYPRIPLWQVMDESTIPFFGSAVNGSGWAAVVGGFAARDNIDKLIEDGQMVKADTVEELAGKMGVDPAVLAATMDAYNNAAGTEADEFERSGEKIRPLSGPLYAVLLYPVMVNTNGGPRHNADGNIMHVDGTPFGRLYAAGEFGSIWAWYYQGASNVSECLAVGKICGRNAAALESWDAVAE